MGTRIRKRRSSVVAAVAVTLVAAVGLWSQAGLATPPTFEFPDMQGMARGHIPERVKAKANQLVQLKTKQAVDVFKVRLTLRPGRHSGWHSHQGLVLTIVEEGTVTEYDRNCTARTYSGQRRGPASNGDAFVDEGDVHLLRNEGTTDAVVTLVAILPPGARPFDSSPPAPCPVPGV